MAEVAPFHSSKYPGVYHVCSNCTEGNNIEPENKAPGRRGLLFKRCNEIKGKSEC